MQVGGYVGAIDQGTSSTRFVVVDRSGACIAHAQREHAQICPQPGWVEHDPREIWHNTLQVIGDALAQAHLNAHDLNAIGIANQRETTLIWDRRTGEPLHNALVWQDTRVTELLKSYLQTGGRNQFRAKTGLPLTTYFSALKLRWLLDNVPQAREMAAAGDLLFGTIDTWLLWNLTGGASGGLHQTDVTNASRTQLMNLATVDWDSELLACFGIPRTMLPKIVPSSRIYGEATVEPIRGTCIGGVLGDQQAALVGQTCFASGEVKNTYGTGCFMLMNTGERPVQSTAGLVTTVAYQMEGERPRYALEGSVAVAGALVRWLRDNLRLISSSSEIEALAREVADNGDVYFAPAFSGLFAPHWQERARGVIVGLTAYANRGHIARAALEATAYQTREILEAMQTDAGIQLGELRVDGGMSDNELLMQFQADILNVPVVRPRVMETTALGAAYAAGLAVKYWRGIDHLRDNWRVERRWSSNMSEQTRAHLYRSWQKCVRRSCDWVD